MAAPRPPGAAGPERLAIVGTGLMGGSLGLASLAEGLVKRVVGWDADAVMLRRALERGAITEEAGSIAEEGKAEEQRHLLAAECNQRGLGVSMDAAQQNSECQNDGGGCQSTGCHASSNATEALSAAGSIGCDASPIKTNPLAEAR